MSEIYPFRFKLNESVKVAKDYPKYGGVIGKIYALELSNMGTIAVVLPIGKEPRPFRVKESQLLRII